MGMPTNQFTLLLRAVDAEQENHTAALNSLEQFKLFALVIVDFERDRAVVEEIGIRWTRLDQMTGPNLLFVAPCAPPSEWLNAADVRARGYVDAAIGNLEQMQKGTLEVADPGAAMSRLIALLGLPPVPVPMIVVFQRIYDTGGWAIETTAREVADDLVRLGGLASDLADGIVNDVEGAIAEKFGHSRYVGRFERRSGSAAEAVVAATAGSLVADSREAAYAKQFLSRLLERRLKEATELLGLLRSRQAGEAESGRSKDYEQALVALADSAGVLCDPEELLRFGLTCREELPADWERWSLDMLERGDRCFARGGAENWFRATPHEWQTPAALCWSLAVEHELASCLGHALREELGIHLPPNWWFVDPNVKIAQVEAGGAKVDLNEGQGPKRQVSKTGRRPWQPPPFGTLRIAGEAVVKGGKAERFLGDSANHSDWEEFFSACAKIGKVRNSFAHPDPDSTVDARNLRKVLIPELWKTKVMRMLVSQKPRWSGRQNPQPTEQDRISRWAEG